MTKKLFAIITICILILTSLTTISITYAKNEGARSIEIISVNLIDRDNITDFWALLVAPSDWFGHPTDHSKYLNYLKNALISLGWKEDHIISLFNENATKKNLFQAINLINENHKQSDTIFIFLGGHGGEGVFELNDDYLYYNELDLALDKLSPAAIGVIISSCYSGSAIPFLQQDNRVIITSCMDNEMSINCFSEIIALGINELADYLYLGDKNGVVSLEEAFNYASKESYWDFSPQIQDDYFGQLHITFQNWSAGKIDQIPSITYYGDGGSWIGNNGIYQASQSFQPSLDVLTKVQLKIERINLNETCPITVSIHKNLTCENLTYTTIIPYELEKHSEKYLTFDFPDINVTPGDTYYIVCSSLLEATSIWDNYCWVGRNNNCYDNGEYYVSEDGGTTWFIPYGADKHDRLFITYGKNKNVSFSPYIPKRPSGPTIIEKNNAYDYYVTTKDVDGDHVYYKFDWGDERNSDWLGPFNSGEIVYTNHSWSNEGIYQIKVKTKDENDAESDWSDILKITVDSLPPKLKFLKPEKALYIMNTKIRKFLIRKPLIIGTINITVNATDDVSGIKRVEFFIDGESTANITTPPYYYMWKREGRMRIFGHRHTIKVVAYDNVGNNASKEIKVWKFL